ncbi:helix-turn-helix domain-containing protein [Candidatus Rhabdochlamydia oedothoracis]|nr:helix-turn-helix domain-containing protein [Candidatus Rhabdochlamydia oedothoracis]
MIFNNQTQGETLPKGYHHLTYDQRCQIYILQARGDTSSSIANILKVHHSTISRELKRNKGQRGYRHQQAQEKAFLRKNSQPNKKMTPPLNDPTLLFKVANAFYLISLGVSFPSYQRNNLMGKNIDTCLL